MVKVIAAVALRQGREAYVVFVPRTEVLGQRIYHMLNDLAREGQLDIENVYIVVGADGTNTNVMVVLPAGDNHEELIGLMLRECALRLSLHAGRLDDSEKYDELVRYARKARAKDN